MPKELCLHVFFLDMKVMRKPGRKPDPGPIEKFYGRTIFPIVRAMRAYIKYKNMSHKLSYLFSGGFKWIGRRDHHRHYFEHHFNS